MRCRLPGLRGRGASSSTFTARGAHSKDDWTACSYLLPSHTQANIFLPHSLQPRTLKGRQGPSLLLTALTVLPRHHLYHTHLQLAHLTAYLSLAPLLPPLSHRHSFFASLLKTVDSPAPACFLDAAQRTIREQTRRVDREMKLLSEDGDRRVRERRERARELQEVWRGACGGTEGEEDQEEKEARKAYRLAVEEVEEVEIEGERGRQGVWERRVRLQEALCWVGRAREAGGREKVWTVLRGVESELEVVEVALLAEILALVVLARL